MNNVIDLDLNNIQILSVKTGEDSSVVKNNTVTQLADVLDFSAERARRKSVTGISTAETQWAKNVDIKRQTLESIGKVQFEECKNEDLLQGSIEGIMRGDQSFQNVMKLNVTAVANDDADRSFKAKQLFPNSKSQQSAEGAEIIASAFFTALREKRKKYVNWINDFTSRLETSGDKTQSQIKTFVGKVEVIIAQIDVMSRKDFKTALYSTTNAIIARASKGGQLEKFKNKNEFNALIGINSPEQLKILPPDIQTMVADFQVYMEAYLLDFVPGKKKVLTKPQLTVVNASK